MPEEATKPADAPAPSPSPADANAPDGSKDAGDYDPQWLPQLDGKRKTDVDAWAEHYHQAKAKDMETELHGLRTKVGRLEKASDPDVIARLGDHETMLEDHKQAVISLYGVTEEDVKDASTVGELRMLMRGLTKSKPAATPPGSDTDPATAEAWKSFMASRGTPTAPVPEHNDEPNRITGFSRVSAGASKQTLVDRLGRGEAMTTSEMAEAQAAQVDGFYPSPRVTPT